MEQSQIDRFLEILRNTRPGGGLSELSEKVTRYPRDYSNWEIRPVDALQQLPDLIALNQSWENAVMGSFSYTQAPRTLSAPLSINNSAVFQRTESVQDDVEIQDGVWMRGNDLLVLKEPKKYPYIRLENGHSAGAQIIIPDAIPLVFRHSHCDDIQMKEKSEEDRKKTKREWDLESSQPSIEDFWALLISCEHQLPNAIEIVTPSVRWLICRSTDSPQRIRKESLNASISAALPELALVRDRSQIKEDYVRNLRLIQRVCERNKLIVYVNSSVNMDEPMQRIM